MEEYSQALRTAYLDIETSFTREITIVGIFYPPHTLIQLVNDEVHKSNLLRTLDEASEVCTYNGSRFDLPVIRRYTGLDVARLWVHRDLMFECWRHGLRGGLKRVEEQLGIPRKTAGMDGFDAMRLWEAYRTTWDIGVLNQLLQYNRDDVVNLEILDARLKEMSRVGCSHK